MIVSLLAFVPASQDAGNDEILLENFEQGAEGGLPPGWVFLRDRDLKPLVEEFMLPHRKFYLAREGDNQFVRSFTDSAPQHIMYRTDQPDRFVWDLEKMPVLKWSWRALRLPPGAREDKVNDSGAAVYVSFDRKDWLGRPHSLKYAYSSTLPVGTVVKTGNVRVLVVANGDEHGTGEWMDMERDVEADYKRIFGKKKAPRAVLITLWTDSDNTKTIGEADFDNLRVAARLSTSTP
ncbi:MAG: DUF3047 domain-containing protein [Bacteroidota bacterium]